MPSDNPNGPRRSFAKSNTSATDKSYSSLEERCWADFDLHDKFLLAITFYLILILDFFKNYIVCACARTSTCACMHCVKVDHGALWRSESVLPSPSLTLSPRTSSQVVGLSTKCLCQLNHLANPAVVIPFLLQSGKGVRCAGFGGASRGGS